MHPIERLRYVARASGAPQSALVQETATALAGFGSDHQALVTACRRIVSRQPTSGPLLWFAARILTAGDPAAEIWVAAGEIQADRTTAGLARALPEDATLTVLGWPDEIAGALVRRGDVEVLAVDTRGEAAGLVRCLWEAGVDSTDVPQQCLGAAVAASDVVLLESNAIGPGAFLSPSGALAAAAVARHCGIPVWLVGGVGRLLPTRMFDGLRSRVERGSEPWDSDEEFVPLELVDLLAGPRGPEPVADAMARIDCPVAPELFRGDVF